MTESTTREILIVAGEASADRYGGRLVENLLQGQRDPKTLEFWGTGGDRMQEAGVELLAHVKDLASIGPREVVAHLRHYRNTMRRILDRVRQNRPEVAVLMDFPDFNLRLAKALKKQRVPVVYYISPQLWAWRPGRIQAVKRYADKMLVILPFEEDYYRKRGVSAQFVGHPLLEGFAPREDRVGFLVQIGLDPERKTVALLPGSRRKEVDHILPTLLQAALLIRREQDTQFVISAAPSVGEDYVRAVVAKTLAHEGSADRFRVLSSDSRDILSNVDFALVKSGTSTLEAALVGTPFLIVYKISALSWKLGNVLIDVPFRGLVNLIAGEEVVPELFQEKATPQALAETALTYLRDGKKSEAMRARLRDIRQMLGAHCASEMVAQEVRSYL